ncbi:hypothetical protein MMC25_000072 [Agyrium rufum]|nr:hypothetical protein [Agyrium rufum]
MPAQTTVGAASSERRENKRGPWNQKEDQQLLTLVQEFGASNWVEISNRLCVRTPKQCRERYHQNLKPSLRHTPITPEESQRIYNLFNVHGPKWAEISRQMPGRSDNSIKNWWNGSMNRRRREGQKAHKAYKAQEESRRSYRQPQSSPREYMQRPLPGLYIPNSYQRMTPPMISPASMPGGTPSLVSDNNSNQSTPSPKALMSPAFHLPKILDNHIDHRRRTVTHLHNHSTSVDFGVKHGSLAESSALPAINRPVWVSNDMSRSASGGLLYHHVKAEPVSPLTSNRLPPLNPSPQTMVVDILHRRNPSSTSVGDETLRLPPLRIPTGNEGPTPSLTPHSAGSLVPGFSSLSTSVTPSTFTPVSARDSGTSSMILSPQSTEASGLPPSQTWSSRVSVGSLLC